MIAIALKAAGFITSAIPAMKSLKPYLGYMILVSLVLLLLISNSTKKSEINDLNLKLAIADFSIERYKSSISIQNEEIRRLHESSKDFMRDFAKGKRKIDENTRKTTMPSLRAPTEAAEIHKWMIEHGRNL